MENSRVTKYLVDRGARFTVVLTSSQYCVSPLVQGGLEIPCEVGTFPSLTEKKNKLAGIYNNLINRKFIPVLKALRKKEDAAEKQDRQSENFSSSFLMPVFFCFLFLLLLCQKQFATFKNEYNFKK